ncbi:MAG TPA: SRPBCC family protein [Solirubrobacteraceae bacterium]
MKELSGSATGVAPASVEECVRFLRAVDRYPTWHPDVVREVEVLDRDGDGYPVKARGKLHVAVGPLVKDFDLILAITVEDARTVKLSRVPHGPGDDERFEVTWRLQDAGAGTRIQLEIAAALSVPRFVPVGGIGDGLAQGFVSSATRALGG